MKAKLKTKTSLVILLICLLPGFLPGIQAQMFTHPKIVKMETECRICGRTIAELNEEENISYFDNMMPITSFYYSVPDSSRIYYIEFNREIKVCRNCLSKYGAELEHRAEEAWNNYLNEIYNENVDKREYYDKLRKLNKLKELQEKINELQKEKAKMGGKNSG